MLPLLLGWAVIAAALAGLARLPPDRPVLLYWAIISLIACILAALAIASQPLGQATMLGRLGSAAVRWGFRASQGNLLGATLISWLIWLVLGGLVLTAVRARGDLWYRLLLLAWAVDFGALCYVVGVWLRNRGSGAPTLLGIAGVLLTLLAASAALWWGVGSPAARRAAVIVAGGPPLALGAGYGLFLLIILTGGRNARWN
jgi:hypothetical protein